MQQRQERLEQAAGRAAAVTQAIPLIARPSA
jgi:hypothetical protein